MEVQVGPPLISIHHDDQVLVCEPNGRMSRQFGQGYFVADTRLASGYRLRIEGLPPTLLNSAAVRSHSARFEFTNPLLETMRGTIPAGALHLRLGRALCQGVHEDYDPANVGRTAGEGVLEGGVEGGFRGLVGLKGPALRPGRP